MENINENNTMIRVSRSLANKLKAKKRYKRETYDEVISKLVRGFKV